MAYFRWECFLGKKATSRYWIAHGYAVWKDDKVSDLKSKWPLARQR
jgi:hypothetical protein